jgi:glycine dehydrogenase subunit 1
MVIAVQATGRTRIAVADTVHPETIAVLRTFGEGRRIGIDVIPTGDGVLALETVRAALTADHAALLVQYPSFVGTIQDLAPLAEAAHDAGALAMCATDLHACALLTPPGESGFDVAVGDGQPLGIPASFGGPHVGFMSVAQAQMRRIPGRLVGMTVDHDERRAYTLTLQAREQHIRREHATSNICTNHALIALAATVYMAHMGAGGMRAIAEVSAQRAHHLANLLTAVGGLSMAHPSTPFLWEFVLRTPGSATTFANALHQRGIVAGLPLGRIDEARDDEILVCCTELTSPQAIERYASAAADVVATERSVVMAHA